MESKGQEEHLGLGSSDPEKSVANLSSDNLAVEGGIGNPKSSGASEEIQKGESHIDIDEPEYREMGKHVVAAEDGGFQESAGDMKDSVAFPERETPKDDDASNDIKASPCDNGIVIAPKPLSVSGKEATGTISIRDGFSEEANLVCLKNESKKMGSQSREDVNQEPTRCDDAYSI